jgi:hypothetical protein
MATTTQIVTRALRRIRVIPAGGTPSAEDLSDGTDALTAMINGWEADGLTGDVLPLDARFEQGVVAMLAVRMAGEYGKEPDAVLLRDATDGWSQISAAFFAVPSSRFDSALKYTGHFTDVGYIIGELADNYDIWQASTQYDLRRFVRNGANLYECITAGTSAASGGPTGTAAEITDGTCVWCWRRVAGEPEER